MFNVGGTHFSATRATIEMLGSTLSNMIFCGMIRDECGLPFIDADAMLFRLILNHARFGAVPEGLQQQQVLRDLRCQATCFGLEQLLLAIDSELEKQQQEMKEQRLAEDKRNRQQQQLMSRVEELATRSRLISNWLTSHYMEGARPDRGHPVAGESTNMGMAYWTRCTGALPIRSLKRFEKSLPGTACDSFPAPAEISL